MTSCLPAFQDLSRLVLPRSIALVGASDSVDSIGGRTYENLTRYSHWRGEIALVNPARSTVSGQRCVPSVLGLEKVPDVAILAVRADNVVGVLQDCGERGIPFAIVFSGGFGETGAAGHAVEAQMRDVVARTGIRVYGPNCPGLNNINAGLGMTFSPVFHIDRRPGRVGIASQGGGLGRCFLQGMDRGLGVGLWCSGGNEADLEVSDYVHYMADAPDIDVIVTALEGIRNGPRFMQAALHAARRGKPIVAIKVGKSDYGVKAAQSHTAAIAGSAEINSAVFRELGIIEVDEVDEMVDVASLLVRRQPTGRERVAVYSFSGGTVAHTCDRIGAAGLELSSFAPPTLEALREALPAYAAIDNPVDVTALVLTDKDITYRTLKTVADDPDTGILAVPIPAEFGPTTARLADSMVRVQQGVQVPIVPIWMSDRSGEGHRAMIDGGLMPMRSVRNAVTAMRRHRDHGRWRTERDAAWQPLIAPAPTGHTAALTEVAAKAVLRAIGIRTPEGVLVRNTEEAAQAFAQLGSTRVAMKIVSAAITHKSDIGGVRLGIATADEARSAFDAIVQAVAQAQPAEAIEGVLVEAMLTAPFTEVVIGIHRDEVFGPICTFGLGGVAIELFKDVSRRLLPLTEASARAMIEETRCHALLAGHRGKPAGDVDALVNVLLRLSEHVVQHADTIEEIEINPLAVLGTGQGVAALDAVLIQRAHNDGPLQ